MPKFYCDYCDIYLTHSSTNGRKQHNSGRKHINNKIDHYKNVIRSPGFSPPLMFDSDYNVIGHLGNVRQFIHNLEKQSYSDRRHQHSHESRDKDSSNKPPYKSSKHFNSNTNNNYNGNKNHGSIGGNPTHNMGNLNPGHERFQHGRNVHGGSTPYSGHWRQDHSGYSNNYSGYYRGNQPGGGGMGGGVGAGGPVDSGIGTGGGGYRPYKRGPSTHPGNRY
ncbi:hypothetical protein OJ253_3094 [Cryptosporidium canis]|uniref:Matrin-type domain-containing protein n=1 Tax=Cryptosporidium canis TaxID=195482 RepID=A0A9D5DI32_9CRYT|nr:hypothetical protein OJ253_3094 [Cryptosporidium canis]